MARAAQNRTRTILDEGSEERHVGLAIARRGRRHLELNGAGLGGLFRVLDLFDLVLAEPIEAAHLQGAKGTRARERRNESSRARTAAH